MSKLNRTPETSMTDEEIAELEKQREAAKEARLAPFKALRRRMDAGLRYAVANDGVTDEELLSMSAATPEWKPGLSLAVGDTVMYGGSMFVVVQAHMERPLLPFRSRWMIAMLGWQTRQPTTY